MEQNLNQQSQNIAQQAPQTPQAPNPVGASIPQAPPTPPPAGQPIGNPPPPFQPPPVQTPPPPPAAESPKGSNKAVLFGGLGVIMLALIGGIYFLAIQYSQKTSQVPEITPIPRVSLSPTPLTEATEKDIDKIDLGDPESELKSIDQDVNQL